MISGVYMVDWGGVERTAHRVVSPNTTVQRMVGYFGCRARQTTLCVWPQQKGGNCVSTTPVAAKCMDVLTENKVAGEQQDKEAPGLQNAMTSSEERASAEGTSSRLHRVITGGLLRPLQPISALEQILDRQGFPDFRRWPCVGEHSGASWCKRPRRRQPEIRQHWRP